MSNNFQSRKQILTLRGVYETNLVLWSKQLFFLRDGPFKCVFSLSLLLQLLGLGQNRLWMVGRIVFANRLIDGFIKTDAPDGRPGQIRPSTRRRVSRCQKIFVKHNLCFMKHKIKPAASTAAEKI